MTRVQADRLLFHRKSGHELKIYYEKDRLPVLTSGDCADLEAISEVIMREGLWAWRIPTRTPKQRLASARAHIRARAAQSRPRLRRP